MITIRRYKRDDARAVAALVSKTYSRFNVNEGTKKAVRRYIESYSPKGKKTEDIHNHFCRTPHCFVAVSGCRVVGMVRGIQNRLVNLFVDGDYHRQGIATRLARRFENACQQGGFTHVVLRGSLYAIPFYQSMGYRKTTGFRKLHGLKIQPMRKELKQRIPTSRGRPQIRSAGLAAHE